MGALLGTFWVWSNSLKRDIVESLAKDDFKIKTNL
jgi:hypothetical protein